MLQSHAEALPPVNGRLHADVQTEAVQNCWEELNYRPDELEAWVQTDDEDPRPPSPLFIPAKVGVDVSTQTQKCE